MNTLTYLYNLISGRTGKQRSIDNVFANGDWSFTQLNNYTVGSPLLITQGNTSKITFNPSDIGYTAGRDLVFNYDFVAQKFLPLTVGDVFLVEIRFKAKNSKQNGHADIKLESPTTTFNPIQAYSFSIPKAASTEQFVSFNATVFISEDVKTNGLEIKATATDGNLSMYDISFVIVRLSSGIPNTP